jgi:hypothetical protein
MTILPDNTLIGQSDELPGVKGSIMPHKMEDLQKVIPSEV